MAVSHSSGPLAPTCAHLRYVENAKIEADILNDIKKADPKGESSRSAIMHDTFPHGKHFCLVFEPCGASLYDFLKRNTFRGFWVQDPIGQTTGEAGVVRCSCPSCFHPSRMSFLLSSLLLSLSLLPLLRRL